MLLYSAGCGRTGAICAIDYTWNLLKAGVREHSLTSLTRARLWKKKKIVFVFVFFNKKQVVRINPAAALCCSLTENP